MCIPLEVEISPDRRILVEPTITRLGRIVVPTVRVRENGKPPMVFGNPDHLRHLSLILEYHADHLEGRLHDDEHDCLGHCPGPTQGGSRQAPHE